MRSPWNANTSSTRVRKNLYQSMPIAIQAPRLACSANMCLSTRLCPTERWMRADKLLWCVTTCVSAHTVSHHSCAMYDNHPQTVSDNYPSAVSDNHPQAVCTNNYSLSGTTQATMRM